MEVEECRRRLAAARVARLATIGADGPHVVPIVFAVDDDRIVFVIDDKPKRTRRLQRLANIEADPRVSVLADHYDDDWSALWWVRADGRARVESDQASLGAAVELLRGRYSHYRTSQPPGPAIWIDVDRWAGWAARS